MRFNSKLPGDITLVPRTGAVPYRRVHTFGDNGRRRAAWIQMGTCSAEHRDVITVPSVPRVPSNGAVSPVQYSSHREPGQARNGTAPEEAQN